MHDEAYLSLLRLIGRHQSASNPTEPQSVLPAKMVGAKCVDRHSWDRSKCGDLSGTDTRNYGVEVVATIPAITPSNISSMSIFSMALGLLGKFWSLS